MVDLAAASLEVEEAGIPPSPSRTEKLEAEVLVLLISVEH